MKIYFHKKLIFKGGAEKLFIEQSFLLKKKDVITVVGYVNQKNFQSISFDKVLSKRNCWYSDILNILRLILLVKKKGVTHIITASGVIDAYIVSKIIGIKLVYEDHHPIGMQHEGSLIKKVQIRTSLRKFDPNNPNLKVSLPNPSLIEIFKNFFLLSIYKEAYKIYVHSNYSRDEKSHLFNREIKVASYLSPMKIHLNNGKTLKPNDICKIVYFGRIVPQKNLELLIKALQNVDKNYCWHLKIVGSSNCNYLDRIRLLISQTEKNNRIEIYENPLDSVYYSKIYNSNLFINTEYVDVNITNIEAIAYGLDVMLPKISFIPSNIGKKIYRFPCYNETSIARAVENYIRTKHNEVVNKSSKNNLFVNTIQYARDRLNTIVSD